MSDFKWVPEAVFHNSSVPIYRKKGGEFFKQAEYMSRVRYEPGHLNPAAPNNMLGEGALTVTWIYGEEAEKNEGLLASDIELMMDSHLEAGASIGLHKHTHTEEIYYLLEGSLTIALFDGEACIEQDLKVGDSHRIAPGQSHFIKAGAEGARFMVVAAKVIPRSNTNHHQI